jgi:hypothetical protein
MHLSIREIGDSRIADTILLCLINVKNSLELRYGSNPDELLTRCFLMFALRNRDQVEQNQLNATADCAMNHIMCRRFVMPRCFNSRETGDGSPLSKIERQSFCFRKPQIRPKDILCRHRDANAEF